MKTYKTSKDYELLADLLESGGYIRQDSAQPAN